MYNNIHNNSTQRIGRNMNEYNNEQISDKKVNSIIRIGKKKI